MAVKQCTKRKVGDLPQLRLMWPAHIVQLGAKCGA